MITDMYYQNQMYGDQGDNIVKFNK